MIRCLAFLLGLALLLPAPFSQAQDWEFKNPLPTTCTFRQVRTLAPGVAIAVGDVGNVAMTSDGGVTWSTSGFSSREAPMRLVVSAPSTCWVVGTGGLIAKSTDGGAHWKVLHQDTMIPELYDAFFPDDQNGIVIGQMVVMNGQSESLAQVIMRTQDGGLTWSTEIPDMDYLGELSFVDRNYGWIAGQRLYRTTDGGTTWQRLASPAQTAISGLKFFDRANGLCWSTPSTGSDMRTSLYATTDSGNSWTCTLDTLFWPRFVVGTGENDLWGAGGSQVFHSTDGGKSWATLFTSYDDTFEDITIDGSTLIAMGAQGRIWQSPDKGVTWEPI